MCTGAEGSGSFHSVAAGPAEPQFVSFMAVIHLLYTLSVVGIIPNAVMALAFPLPEEHLQPKRFSIGHAKIFIGRLAPFRLLNICVCDTSRQAKSISIPSPNSVFNSVDIFEPSFRYNHSPKHISSLVCCVSFNLSPPCNTQS